MSTALEVIAYQADGTARPRAVRLPADPFDGRVHEPAMHQAVKVFLANQRQGTAQAKTRGFVSGGNRKPWRQKGTGRARQGSIRSPLWPGGGTIFGPVPRDYRLGMPKKLRQLARRSALNARAREGALTVIAPLAFSEPRTKQMAALLARMGLTDRKVLVLLAEARPAVLLSARNIPGVTVQRYADATTYEILRADAVVIEEAALGALETGTEVTVPVPAPKRAKAPRAAPAAAEAKAAAPARPAARKAAAKKAAPAKKAAARKAAKPAAKKPAARKAAVKKPGRKKE